MNIAKDFIDSHLPIPFRISDWDNGDRILYQCPKCRASFQFFGDSEYDSCPQEEVLAFLCILYRKAKKRKEEAEMEKKK